VGNLAIANSSDSMQGPLSHPNNIFHCYGTVCEIIIPVC